MPEDLKKHIKAKSKNSKVPEVVWVSCEGEYPADKDHIGKISYYTHEKFQGFNGRYYPYSMQNNYKQPLVALQFDTIQSEHVATSKLDFIFWNIICFAFAEGVIVNIECKAWAKNIVHDRTDRRGSVHLEIMVDDKQYDDNYVFIPKK